MAIFPETIIDRRLTLKSAPAGGLHEDAGGPNVGRSGTQVMLASDLTFAQRLEEFMRSFRADFRRREQAEWVGVYLQGLLQTEGRKTIDNLSRSISLPPHLRVDDVSQALQHFINQSPWDERRISHRYQRCLAEHLNMVPGVFILDEFVFVKHGRRSVGVQRQYSVVLGCKVNCQVAVAPHHLSAMGFLPIAYVSTCPGVGWRIGSDSTRPAYPS
jgi:SRSO17 transposase